MVIFETDRLIIREYNYDDTQLVMRYSQEKCKRNELPDEVFETIEEATNQINMCMENYAKNKYPLVYAIVLKEANILIGDILLCPIKEGIEIGYSIAENYQGKGFATEVIKPFVNWAKGNLHLNLIYGLAKKSKYRIMESFRKSGFYFFRRKKSHFLWRSIYISRICLLIHI